MTSLGPFSHPASSLMAGVALACLSLASCATRIPLPYNKNLVENPGFEDHRVVHAVAHKTPPAASSVTSGAPGWGSINQRHPRSRGTAFTVTALTASDRKVFESGEQMLLVSASKSQSGVSNHMEQVRLGREVPDGITRAGVKLCILSGSVRLMLYGQHGHVVSRTIRAVETLRLPVLPGSVPKPDFHRFYLTYDCPGDPVDVFTIVAAEDNTCFFVENASLVVKERPMVTHRKYFWSK